MHPPVEIHVVIIVVAVLGVCSLLWNGRTRRRRALEAIARRTAGEVQFGKRLVHGHLGPIAVTLRINKSGGQPISTPTWTTTLTARVPPAAPLELEVQPAHAAVEGLVLPTGDDGFDGDFCVTGVPSDVVPLVFTSDLRRRLKAFRPGAEWRLGLKAGLVELEVSEALWDLAQATSALELCAALAAEVPAAQPAADAAVRARMPSAPYRGAVDQSYLQVVQQTRAEELQLVAGRRADLHRFRVGLAIVAGLLGLFALYASMR